MTGPVIITGGSRGIGAAVARILAAQGRDVAINYVARPDAAEAVVAECQAAGVRALAVAGDVAVEADVLRMFETVDAELGPLSGLVNNAGIVGLQAHVESFTAERIERMMAVNVVGSFLCAREAVRRMSTARGGAGGAIVNLSSAASRLGSPGEYVDYAASKGAVDSMTLGLAREVAADGIRVNAVRGGLIYTEIHTLGGEPERVDRLAHTVPMQRGGTAAEVAEAVVWLLSPEASYVTGALLDVAGGR